MISPNELPLDLHNCLLFKSTLLYLYVPVWDRAQVQAPCHLRPTIIAAKHTSLIFFENNEKHFNSKTPPKPPKVPSYFSNPIAEGLAPD